MSDILTRILATKQQEVAAAQAALSLAELRARAADMPPPRGFVQAMRDQHSQGRAAVSLPVLRKDFMVSAYQIHQSRAMGADAVLLIAAALSQTQLEEFEGIAHELGMAVLLELHHADELEKCRRLTTPLRGVNNRNLRTFEVSLQQTLDLLPEIADEGRIVITESGIRSREDVQFMRSHGVHSFLIGETFMRADDVGAEVKKLFA